MNVKLNYLIRENDNYYKVTRIGPSMIAGINLKTDGSRLFRPDDLYDASFTIYNEKKEIEEICEKIEEEKLMKHNKTAGEEGKIDIEAFKKKGRKERWDILNEKTDFTFVQKSTLCNSLPLPKIEETDAEKTRKTNTNLRDLVTWGIQSNEDLYFLLAKKVSQAKYGNKNIDKEFITGNSNSDVRISESDHKIITNILKEYNYDKIVCLEKVQEEMGIEFQFLPCERITR